MEPKGTSFGGSLLVPSVQELAKEPLLEIPSRYIRTDQDPIVKSSVTSLPTTELPIIDMQLLMSDDSAAHELERLHIACKEWGFFKLINHGLSSALLEKVKKETQEFFNLPMDVKKKFWQHEGDMEGFGQGFVMSEEQKLDWADMFYIVTLPHDMRKPHLFPKLPLPFRDTLETYSSDVKKISLSTLMFIAKASKMKAEDMKVLFEEGLQSMRMNYYPPCPQPEKVIGFGQHSDSFGITFLLQINEVEGLEIKKDGNWTPVKPLPNSFIVNVGDTLEVISLSQPPVMFHYQIWIVTNGLYKSIEHRAMVNSNKERLSIATFLAPNLDGKIGPAPSLITPETPSRFLSVSVMDYIKDLFSGRIHGKSNIEKYRI
ncbi:hypothetical protein M8C21_008378 [Ambrosia artemisiifolia]|uniref:Fe2OG dioxygenase domain-containing protein n=1 Tax=Ambrosia artemisiifolia TaxID=4212 RepID=A0AAD5D2X2_AMBAR|nr:hypothetical protein M8C21_008378 [Ambrosia artemisiifolia]